MSRTLKRNKNSKNVEEILEPISTKLPSEEILQIACDTILEFFHNSAILVTVVLKNELSPSKLNLKAFSIQDGAIRNTDKKKKLFYKHYEKIIAENPENTAYNKAIEEKIIIKEDLSNIEFKETAILKEQGINYRIVAPLINPHSDEVLGTINLNTTDENFDIEAAKHIIQQVASQIAIALENTQNFTLAKKNAKRSLLVNRLFYEIHKSNDLDSIITNSVNQLGEIMESSRCFFAGIAFDDWVIQAEHTAPGIKKIVGLTGPVSYGMKLLEDSIEHGYIAVNDIAKDIKPKYQKLFELYDELGVKSFLYLPIKMKGKVCGVLGLSQQDYSRSWSSEEIELLEIVRDQISVSITQAQLINDLKTSNERLLELDRLKSQLMSTVSHELRTPMANILGFSELLLHREFSPETNKQYITEIYSASQRLSNLIQDFLDLSRIEATGKMPIGPLEEIEIDWIAENAWNQVSSMNRATKIKWDKPDDLPPVNGDPEGINRVFSNLFSNAIKYSPAGSTITCTIDTRQSDISITVKDEGMGIAPDMVASIFDRFFRVDNSDTRRIGGTGLGLSICKEIVNAHGGQIWCESEEGKGSSFSFTLPINTNMQNNGEQAQIWLS